MKKITLTLLSLFLITPCLANIHINPSTVESVVKEFVPADKVVSVISEYNNQLKASNGAGISAQKLWNVCAVAGWDIKRPDGKNQCKKFVNELVRKASIKFYPACDKQYKGKAGYICVDDFFTNKLYGGTQVNLTPALTLAKEYIRVKYNDNSAQCKTTSPREITVVMGATDYGVQCTSHNQNAYYEFIFDDVKEPKDKTIQDSIQTAVCKMYDAKATVSGCNTSGTNINTTTTCWGASCQADAKKCEQINQSLAQFGYSAVYQDDECRIDFNTVHDKADLKSAYGIDNFVFCHGIQVANTPNVETYLKQYIAERAGVSASSVKCDSGFNTYTGDGCAANGITNLKDDIKTCRVGDNQIDFVFDDINEKWKKTAQGGVQGMSCIVTGGTYSGKRCVGLGEQQCNILRQSNLTECPECKAAKWDDETQSCILPSSKSAQNLQRGINITMIVGGAIVGIVITVATVGTATAAVAGAAAATKSAIAFTAIETVGAGIEVAAQLKIDAIADDFLVESNKCKDATCAKEMLSQNLQRVANYANDMTAAEADAVDTEMARLANLIPDDDEIWATILVNGTDMADNKLGFFDTDSWEPEQVWRAVGIGLQLTSLITGITKWAISKSSRIAKSTAAIKTKLKRNIPNYKNPINPEIITDQAVRSIYVKAYEAEPEITNDLLNLIDDMSGDLHGLEYRMKTPESTLEKIARDRADIKSSVNITDADIAGQFKDLVRYTYATTPENLVEETTELLKQLENNGYKIGPIKNTFVDKKNPVDMINIRVESPTGQVFELQANTPNNLYVKDILMHKDYEAWRIIEDKGSPEAVRLMENMLETAKQFEKPKGIENFAM